MEDSDIVNYMTEMDGVCISYTDVSVIQSSRCKQEALNSVRSELKMEQLGAYSCGAQPHPFSGRKSNVALRHMN